MKYSIKTKMTKEECIEYTKDNLPKSGWMKKYKYLGYVNDKGFKITVNPSTNSYYKQNSFKPVNVGKIEEHDSGVIIRVKQRLSIAVSIFSTIICIFALFIIGIMSLEIVYGEDYSLISCLLIPIVILIVVIISCVYGFRNCATKDMEEIKKMYAGK